jgi:hypothetical protein
MNRLFPNSEHTTAAGADASLGSAAADSFIPAQSRVTEPTFSSGRIPALHGNGKDGNHSAPATVDFPITETLQPSTSPAEASAHGLRRGVAEVSPEGPGTDGHKPLMRNRVGDVMSPSAIGYTAGENFDLTGYTQAEVTEARERENLLLEWRALQDSQGLSGRAAAQQLSKPASWFSQLWPDYEARGLLALLPRRRGVTGAKPQVEVPDWFIAAARFFYLPTNRTKASGSVPEAIRCTASLPLCPPNLIERLKKKLNVAALPECPAELRQLIFARERERRPMLPARLMRQISAREAVVRQHRNPTDAALDLLNAPGSMMWIHDPVTGERRFIRAGDVFEADDATINFPVCVPWTIGGCPCSDRYGVKVGRFQWLVSIDAASRFVPGYSYVMRPRSSYRAEDVLALMKIVTRKWGIPRQWRFEQGVWKSNLVRDAIRNMGSQLHTVWSPHQKPFIEGLFSTLWTKLSVQLPDAQVGRFRGENEKANELLTACQRGHRDPRNHFPMLADALRAFDYSIAEKHRTPVQSVQYGSWIPEERWQQQLLAAPLTPLPSNLEWLFAPFAVERKVAGMLVRTRVPLFEGLSVPFDFAADWLTHFHRARVKVHFDPSEPRCFATIVLAEDWGTHKAGEVLGVAQQINEVASYARFVMSWGDDDRTAGLKQRQQAAAALRREVRAIMPNGRTGAAVSEERDGIAAVAKIETGEHHAKPQSHEEEPSELSASAPSRETTPTREERARELAEFEKANAHLFV